MSPTFFAATIPVILVGAKIIQGEGAFLVEMTSFQRREFIYFYSDAFRPTANLERHESQIEKHVSHVSTAKIDA